MSTPKERILQYIEKQGFTVGKFCKINLLSHSLFDNKAGISSEKMTIITENNPDLNPQWVMTGKGEMINQEISKELLRLTTVNINNELFMNNELKYPSFEMMDDKIERSPNEVLAEIKKNKEMFPYYQMARAEFLSTRNNITTLPPIENPLKAKQSEPNEWKEKYYALMEKYNACLEDVKFKNFQKYELNEPQSKYNKPVKTKK